MLLQIEDLCKFIPVLRSISDLFVGYNNVFPWEINRRRYPKKNVVMQYVRTCKMWR